MCLTLIILTLLNFRFNHFYINKETFYKNNTNKTKLNLKIKLNDKINFNLNSY